jgi:hypothetical protein
MSLDRRKPRSIFTSVIEGEISLRVKLPGTLMAIFALLSARFPRLRTMSSMWIRRHHERDFSKNVGKPIAARACPTKTGGTQYRGAAEFLEPAAKCVSFGR